MSTQRLSSRVEPGVVGAGSSPPGSGSRIDAIDGLRALAVVAVVAFHFGAPLPGGFIGVDLFFVISGFVISRLLVKQHAVASGLRYGSFLARRVRRLLPALVVVLAVTLIWLSTAEVALQRAGDKQTVAAAAYLSNWYAIFGKQSYWDIHSDLTPLNHLWSLSVEEQFYLVWPWALMLILMFVPRRMWSWAALALAGASYGLAFWLGMTDTQRAYLGTDTRAGALLLGAALALALADRSRGRQAPPRSPAFVTWAGAVALGSVVMACFVGWTIASPALYAGGLLVVGLAETALVWSLVHGGPLARFFGSRLIRGVGRASYSIYLWHWVIWVALTSMPSISDSLRPVLAVAATILLSVVSYRFVELPLQRRAPRTVVIASLVALVILAAVALGTMPPEISAAGLTG